MFGHIADLLKKREWMLKRKEPLFADVDVFLKEKYPQLAGSIRAVRYSNGILIIGAKSAGTLQEFFYCKEELSVFLRDKKYSVHEIRTQYIQS